MIFGGGFIKRLGFITTALAAGSITGGCKSRNDVNSNTKNFTHQSGTNNAAVLFSSPNGLKDIENDAGKVGKILTNQSQSGFRKVDIYQNADRNTIITKSIEAAQNSRDGTLFFYFVGHGDTNGALYAEGYKAVYPSEIVEAIKGSGHPKLGRIVFMIDACYSGNLSDGNTKVSLTTSLASAETFDSMLKNELAPAVTRASIADGFINAALVPSTKSTNLASGTDVYVSLADQVVVMTSSSKTEKSRVLFSGASFTATFETVFNHYQDKKIDPTLAEFMATIDDVLSGLQHPQLMTIPASLGKSEKLFAHSTDISAATDPTPTPPQPTASPIPAETKPSTINNSANISSADINVRKFDDDQLLQIQVAVNLRINERAASGQTIQCSDLLTSLVTTTSKAFRGGQKISTTEISQITSILMAANCR